MCSLWQEMLPFRADAFPYENRNANWKTQIGNRITFGKILPNVPNLNLCITKTCLYNFDPLKPHFCIKNWGLQGYTLFFSFLLKNIDCGYSRRFYRVPTINVLSRNMKNIRIFYLKIFIFMVVKFSVYLNRHVFVMDIVQSSAQLSQLLFTYRLDSCYIDKQRVPCLDYVDASTTFISTFAFDERTHFGIV